MLYCLGFPSFTKTQNLVSRMSYFQQIHEIQNHEYLKNLPKQKRELSPSLQLICKERQGKYVVQLHIFCDHFEKITKLQWIWIKMEVNYELL